MKQVGVAWKKTTQKGQTFLSVVITTPQGPDISLSIWPNGFKEKDGQPDYIVYKSGEERPAPAKPDFPDDEGKPDNEDIPF